MSPQTETPPLPAPSEATLTDRLKTALTGRAGWQHKAGVWTSKTLDATVAVERGGYRCTRGTTSQSLASITGVQCWLDLQAAGQ
jgi:hypothetical protein